MCFNSPQLTFLVLVFCKVHIATFSVALYFDNIENDTLATFGTVEFERSYYHLLNNVAFESIAVE